MREPVPVVGATTGPEGPGVACPHTAEEQVSFEAFVADRAPALLRLAFVLAQDRYEADDLVQTALLKVLGRWRRVAATGQPEAYVRRVLVNAFVDGRRRRRERPGTDGDLPEPVPAPDHAQVVADRAALAQALATLPRRQCAVLVLRYFEGQTDDEIAVTLGCTSGTVRGYASRALARLRETWPADPAVAPVRPAHAVRATPTGAATTPAAATPSDDTPAEGR